MAVATRLSADGMRSAVKAGFHGLWKIEGQTGIWQYVNAVKKDYKPADGEVIAESGPGSLAVFKLDTVVMEVLAGLI